MKRLASLALALLLLPGASFAQTITHLKVYVTFTKAAQQKALSNGTNVQEHVQAGLDSINTTFLASSIFTDFNVANPYNALTDYPLRPAIADSASGNAHWTAAKWSEQHWTSRTNTDASYTIHVTDQPGSAGATIHTSQPASVHNSIVVIPYDILWQEMENALATMLGKGNGIAVRHRSLNSEPLAGANYCYHTKENLGSDIDVPVPSREYYVTWSPNGNHPEIPNGRAATKQQACNILMTWYRNQSGGNATIYATANVVEGIPLTCIIKNSSGSNSGGSEISYTPSSGNLPISGCTDHNLGIYAHQGTMAAHPFLPTGWPGTGESVVPMNARSVIAKDWTISANGGVLTDVKNRGFAGTWAAVKKWFKD